MKELIIRIILVSLLAIGLTRWVVGHVDIAMAAICIGITAILQSAWYFFVEKR